MRKVILILVITLFFSSVASANIITVDDSGGQDYLTIQEAVNAADYAGDTILVQPGTYKENIIILDKSINLTAASSDVNDTIIEAVTPDDIAIDVQFILSAIPLDIEVSGFTIQNSEIGVDKSIQSRSLFTSFVLTDNHFMNNTYGIKIYEMPHSFVQNNKFSDNDVGFYLYRAEPTLIEDNVFVNNKIGLKTWDCTPEIESNEFFDNECGIDSKAGNTRILNNSIQNNVVGISTYGYGVKIYGNVIQNNIDCGIDITSSGIGSSLIYNNYFSNNKNIDGSISGWVFDSLEDGINIAGGPSIGGNFWGSPDMTGFSQTHPDLDSDGFCDEEYVINEYAVDHYPLAEMQIQNNIASAEVPEFPTIALPMIAIVGLALFFKRR